MRLNKFYIVAFIYFFINSLGLPFGLTFTAILSPLFYWYILVSRKKDVLIPFFVCLSPFFIMQLIYGVDSKSYLVSVLNFAAVYIFCQAFYTYLISPNALENIFKKILFINCLLCLVAIPIYFTSFDSLLWTQQTLSDGIDNFKRLKLFTYEPSYYALLFAPVFFFFFLKIILGQNKLNSWLLFFMLLLPLVLSFSIGVIAAMLLSAILTYIIHFKKLTVNRRVIFILFLSLGFTMLFVVTVYFLFPKNTVFIRLENILSGNDTSGKGRTVDAFVLAMQMLKLKTSLWGIGAGQIKILGADIVKSYYLYDLDYNNIAIPNAAAETLALFGWVGFGLRLLLQVGLFFYTRVWTNYFRLLLFIFIFIYQFTGSFITNTAEYVIWILAFVNVFPCFDVNREENKIVTDPQLQDR